MFIFIPLISVYLSVLALIYVPPYADGLLGFSLEVSKMTYHTHILMHAITGAVLLWLLFLRKPVSTGHALLCVLCVGLVSSILDSIQGVNISGPLGMLHILVPKLLGAAVLFSWVSAWKAIRDTSEPFSDA